LVEILEGVYSVDHSEARDHSMESWILDCDDGVVLVDGGMTGQHVKNLEAELKVMGKGWGDVKLILVTHKHGDHINNLPRLVELTGAPVKSQRLEAPLIEKATEVKVEGLEDREVVPFCGGIEVIHVPGHSEGNCSYYLGSRRAIIGGDTIFGDPEGNLTPPPERYCLDVEQATREMRRLLDYEFDAFIYTHGRDIMKDAKRRVRELVESC